VADTLWSPPVWLKKNSPLPSLLCAPAATQFFQHVMPPNPVMTAPGTAAFVPGEAFHAANSSDEVGHEVVDEPDELVDPEDPRLSQSLRAEAVLTSALGTHSPVSSSVQLAGAVVWTAHGAVHTASTRVPAGSDDLAGLPGVGRGATLRESVPVTGDGWTIRSSPLLQAQVVVFAPDGQQ